MNFIELLEKIPDPRQGGKVKHSLSSIIFTSLCAILSGAESWSDIRDYCRIKMDWLAQYVDLSHGVPSQWTFRRLFIILKPEVIEWLLRSHASSLVANKESKDPENQIAIDGKCLRGSARHNMKYLQSVSAWSTEHNLVLAQTAVSESSNEIAAIPTLLSLLQLKGFTISIDSAGCQKTIAEQILEQKGFYVFALKKNQPKLYEEVKSYFTSEKLLKKQPLEDHFDNGHGRLVRRRYFTCNLKRNEKLSFWPGLKTAIAVETITSKDNSTKVSCDWRYYITNHKHNNEKLAGYIRNHWSIENKLHWVLDVHMKEDDDQKAERRSAKAFAGLKRIALNVARSRDTNSKRSLRRKFKCAGWDNDYLLTLLR